MARQPITIEAKGYAHEGAAYIRFAGKPQPGEVAETVEIGAGACFADYDANGQLIGFELLGQGVFVVPWERPKEEPKS